MKVLNLIYSVLALLMYGSAFSQDVLFTPKQLKEDAEFCFRTISQMHPNQYSFKSLYYVESLKNSIIERLTHGMNKYEFSKIMATINHCFDGHTWVSLEFLDEYSLTYISEGGKILPPVFIEEDCLFTNYMNKKTEIVSINGIKVSDMLSVMRSYISPEHIPFLNFKCQDNINAFLVNYYFEKSPFRIEGLTKKGRKINWVESGLSFPKSALEPKKRPEYQSSFFPAEDIALLTLNSFQKADTLLFRQNLTCFFDSLQQYKINNLFIDVTRNRGGHNETWMILFDYLKHDTLFVDSEIGRKLSKQYLADTGRSYTEEQVGQLEWKSVTKDITSLPRTNGYSGNIYILQGIRTYSAADQFCRFVSQNNIGVRIGRETGQPIDYYSYSIEYEMPNTKLSFSCSMMYFNIPVKTNRNGLNHPDVFYPLDDLDLKDVEVLKKILSHVSLY